MKDARKVQSRPEGAWETSTGQGLYRRLTLRRADGRVYLDRWSLAHDRIGGLMLHRMEAPDPGVDLHDHPWWFASLILWGGYSELRAHTRTALNHVTSHRRVGSIRTMCLDECHTIISLDRRTSWSLVIKGPRRRSWGFYVPVERDGVTYAIYMREAIYDATVRAERRDLWSDQHVGERPW